VRALVVGARGFVGTATLEALRARGYEVVGSSRADTEPIGGVPCVALDLRDGDATLSTVEEVRPRMIVHLAAEPDVRKAEEPEARADATTITATTARLADQCNRAGTTLVYLSTDYVFDGSSGPYAEEAAPSPLGEYGRSKLAAEAAAARATRSLVVRTSMVYGWPRPGQHPNFVSRLVGAARRGETTTAFADVVRTPIYVGHLAALIADLVARGATGLYHAGSSDAVSMLDLSLQACDAFGLPATTVVAAEAGRSDPSRPLVCGLEVTKAASALRRPLARTEEGLRVMKEEELAYA